MKTHFTPILTILSLASTILMVGCRTPDVYDVPPGYIAKILTPSGWEKKVLEAGQVDIGDLDPQGRGNQLVLCEASAVSIKESFGKANPNGDNEDHRIITRTRVPLTVDIYIQVMVPDQQDMRDSIFAQITAEQDRKNSRVRKITLQKIYEQFARMTIRGKTRQIFSRYKNYDEIMDNYDKVNTEISQMIANTFNNTHTPLKILAGQLSNVKPDETVWAADNRNAAANADVEAINKIGKAIKENPGYLQKYKWDVLKEVAGNGTTIIVNESGSSNDSGGGGVGYNLQVGKK